MLGRQRLSRNSKLHPNSQVPQKKPRKGTLSDEAKREIGS
jgi:hypothetical protein